jgi:capsular polysaccharide biosynthesis protein
MTEHHSTNGPPPAAADDRIRLLDYAAVLLREWRTIALVLATTVVLGLGIVWARPDQYVSRTTLVPAQSGGDSRAQLMSALPAGLAARMGGGGGNQTMVGSILKSQTLRDTLAARVGGDRRAASEVHLILGRHTQIRQNPGDGSIVVDVAAPSPELAHRIADAFPSVINEIGIRLSVEAAARKEEVVQRQLADAQTRLASSEAALLAFQKQVGAADVSEQARQTLTTAAQFAQAIIQQELEVARLRRTVTPDNPRLQAAVADLEALRAQQRRITTGRSGNDVFVDQGQVPELQAEAARLMRAFTRDEQVYVALSAALVGAQVDVKDNTALVTVLDPPVLPTAPAGSPRRTLMIAAVLGLVLGVIVAFVREYMRRVPDDPESRTFMLALEEFRGDVGRMLPHRRRTGTESKV